MTIAKQDPVAWRKRVDQKLNTLTKDFKVLATQQEAINEKFLKWDLGKIDHKLDTLLARHERKGFWKRTGSHVVDFFTSVGGIGWGVAAILAVAVALGMARALPEALRAFLSTLTGH